MTANGLGRPEARSGELERILALISHDFRAPLRAISGFATGILDDCGPQLGEEGHAFAQRIVVLCAHLDRLARELVDYGRIGTEPPRLQPVELGAVVADALRLMAGDIERTAAQVTVAAELGSVVADRGLLLRCISHLLANAVTYIPDGATPSVRVTGERSPGLVRLRVEDDGIGIDPQFHDRIFELGERLHGQGDRPGTGIGLAIVQHGIGAMGGTCGVSSSPGGGSTFWIELAEVDGSG